ncbi:cytochrome b562 [Coraliomargarita sinensis]|nr:cytochrome b562 [Coraliomargarita sinensis]
MMNKIHTRIKSLRRAAALAFALTLGLNFVPAAASADGYEKESVLHDKMEVMQDHYRSLGRGLRRPSAEDLPDFLDAVQQLQVLTVQTKTLVPPMANSLPEGKRPAFVMAYRQKQLDTLRTLIDMEEALLEADFEKANELFDALKKHKSEGHESFKEDD